jgi:hypothetical protein
LKRFLDVDQALRGGSPQYTQRAGDTDVSPSRLWTPGGLIDQQKIRPHRLHQGNCGPFTEVE